MILQLIAWMKSLEEEVSDSPLGLEDQYNDLQSNVELHFAAALLKLEYLVHVPGRAVDFLQEIHNLLNSASVPLCRGFVS